MPIPALRAKQTSSTTGTGTLTLNAASSEFRSFQAAFGASSQKVRYILSRAGDYEVGYGTFNGGSPGTLTRDTVVASSNGGALVSWSAGVTDVFFDFLPGDRRVQAVSNTTTLALEDLGNAIRTQQTANITLNLPAVATVPAGMGYLIRNEGTTLTVVYIDPNGTEGIDGQTNSVPLFVGETVEVLSVGSAWRTFGLGNHWREVGRALASSSASIDLALPAFASAAASEYKVEFRNLRPATDGALLNMRTSSDGGATFAAGASDYVYSFGAVTGAATWAGQGSTAASGMLLSMEIDNTAAGNTCYGVVHIFPGTNGLRNPCIHGRSFTQGNVYAGPQIMLFGGARNAAQDINAVRFVMSTGNISLGSFVLSARFG